MSLSLLPLFWFASLSLFCHVTNDFHLAIFEARACFEERLLVRIRNLGANVHLFRDLNEGFLRAVYIGFWGMMPRYRVASYGFWKRERKYSQTCTGLFWDAIIYFIGYDSCEGKLVPNSSPKNIPIRQFDTTPTQSWAELAEYIYFFWLLFFSFCDS